jgi:hypothetical protein
VSSTAGEINDTAGLIWYTKNMREDVKETLTTIAEEYLAEVKKGTKDELLFFFSYDEAKDDEDTWASLSTFANIPVREETLCLINIPDQQVIRCTPLCKYDRVCAIFDVVKTQ